MSFPGAPNPADQLKEVAKELKEEFDKAGMAAVETFVDTIEEIKTKAAAGPSEIMGALQKKMDDFKGKLEDIVAKPETIAPASMAALASWYGAAVAAKLMEFKAEVEKLISQLIELAKSITAPMKKMGDVLGEAMKALEKTLSKLSKLPKEVGKMAADIDSPDDIAKIDVDSMKQCLDVSGIESPLKSMGGLGDTLRAAMEFVRNGVQMLAEFIEMAGDQLKGAFNVPAPLCFVTPCALSQAPPVLTDLLGMVESLKEADMGPLLEMLEKTMESLGEMDTSKVTVPVQAFSNSASGCIGKLEKCVQGAKLAGNPAGALGALPASPF